MRKTADVVDSEWGYKRLSKIPSTTEAAEYYATYYQQSRGNYRRSYSPEEIRYFRNRLSRHRLVIERLLPGGRQTKRMLDVGCGEGWAMDHFAAAGWDVTGVDLTDAGLRAHHPALASRLLKGDHRTALALLAAHGCRFDLVWLGNVIEHVPEPLSVLTDCAELCAPGAILCVEVPNDFSHVQRRLLAMGMVDHPFWVISPDHINYFDAASLREVCLAAGWEFRDLLADYPIDWHLFNADTNYVADPRAGPGCHATRVAVENLLYDTSPELANELFRALGAVGGGRQVTGFFQLQRGNTYRALPIQRVAADGYEAVPLRRRDMLQIGRWRNEQIDALRQQAPVTEADQFRYYDEVVSATFAAPQPSMLLFSILLEGDCIGYGGLTNIDWTARRAELSVVFDTCRARDAECYDRDLSGFLAIIKQLTFNELRFHRLFAETFDIRPHHVSILERHGFLLEGRLRAHARVGDVLVDSLMHGLIVDHTL